MNTREAAIPALLTLNTAAPNSSPAPCHHEKEIETLADDIVGFPRWQEMCNRFCFVNIVSGRSRKLPEKHHCFGICWLR